MSTELHDVEVLVAGAGPAGLCTAYNLARHGVRVRVVDRAPGPAVTSRALATHARSLEIYDQMGVLDELLARGRRVEHFTLHQNGSRIVRFDTDYSRLPTRFPFTLMVDQTAIEQVLRDALERHGVPVEWGVELTTFTPGPDAVRVELRTADGRTGEVTAGWLVGCDGGRSTVRKQLGLPLLGSSTETWLIADAVVENTGLPSDSIHLLHAGSGSVMLVPFPETGKWRLLDTVDAADEDPGAVAARFSAKIEKALGRPVRVRRPSWVSVFTIQQRMVPGMRSGRCLVAGDAAHVHSPASGQGLNTGVQDAYNLAWKLAMVVRGQAGPGLLDSYPAERVPIGRALLSSTRKATLLVALKNRAMAIGLPVAGFVLRRVPPLKRAIERTIMGAMSALLVRYADSPLTPDPSRSAAGARVSRVTADDAASPGWRALLAELREPRWHLIATGQDGDLLAAIAGRHGDWLGVRVVAPDDPATTGALADPDGTLRRTLGLTPRGWLLVRPDGYVATGGDVLTGDHLDPLAARLLHRQPGAALIDRETV